MPLDARPSAFVTGAGTFLGSALVHTLVARGYRVSALAESIPAAQRLRRAGALPVLGDLLEEGPWQDEAAADCVFHVPRNPPGRWRITARDAERLGQARLLADAHLLDAVSGSSTRRIVYVADTSCYRTRGRRPATEDEPVQLTALGRALAPALDRIEGYTIAGLPITTAMPGSVYGNGSWFRDRVIEPVVAERRVLRFGTTDRWMSPIHVEDCARALVHVAEWGEPARRYFLVNSDPARLEDLAVTFARLVKRRLRVWTVPARAARFLVGSIDAECLLSDAIFSNIRLRATGFRFRYPTVEEGLQAVAAERDPRHRCPTERASTD